jgi:hypothetical protein
MTGQCLPGGKESKARKAASEVTPSAHRLRALVSAIATSFLRGLQLLPCSPIRYAHSSNSYLRYCTLPYLPHINHPADLYLVP